MLADGIEPQTAFRLWISGPTPLLPIDRQVYSIEGRIIADHIIGFERLDEDLRKAVTALALPNADFNTLGHFKRREPIRSPLSLYYDECAIEIVRILFDFEFRELGYPDRPSE